jgi:AcrR family transcriptional regulator
MASEVLELREQAVRDRLITAADDELAEHGSLTGRFEDVAHRAGVSRATAYRQLGSISELLTQVGLRRSEKHTALVRELMGREGDALSKIEAAMIYSARELPNEPIVLDLISRRSAALVDPEVRRLITDVLAPALAAGQASGEIRTDLDRDAMIEYLTEQCYLATQAADRSAAAVRRRFRCFIAPCLTSPTPLGTQVSLESAVAQCHWR